MFEQVELPILDAAHFRELKETIEPCFAPGRVAAFLRELQRARLRVRDFEGLLAGGYLGSSATGIYSLLPDSDRGQIREWYLRLVEQVAP